jgi:hypothetical protein
MKFKEIEDKFGKPFKLITPDSYVGYYKSHTSGCFSVHIVWLSMKPNSKKEYPYPIPKDEDIDDWEVTETEECNINELFTKNHKP